MKKYILATLILFIPCVTYALTMCARDNSLVVALNSSINASSSTYNASEFTWRVNFEYGTILGEATCLSEAEGGKPSNTTAASGVMTNTDGEMLSHDIPKGYNGTSPANADNPELNTERIYCWCRMTHPSSSPWVFRRVHTTGTCTPDCANGCALDMFRGDIRAAMFKSIGQ